MENSQENEVNSNDARREALRRVYEGLENKEYFTVEEAACLLLRSPMSVKQAVRRGELHGVIVDHRVICISREAILEWLRTRPRP